MDKFDFLFHQLWEDYTNKNSEVIRIHNAFVMEGEAIVNDHIAFRTFNHPKVNLDKLSKKFRDLGYVEKQTYTFEQKKLFAKHFEHPDREHAPRVFISELLLEHFSEDLQSKINSLIDMLPDNIADEPDFLVKGNVWEAPPSFEMYEKLRAESEYAAWLYLYGYTPNHFTISINHLKKYPTIEEVNEFLKNKGYILNQSGGEIKGTREELLQQSSTMASIRPVKFVEGEKGVPLTFYEFALRFPDKEGNIYSGFIAASADKIFESTDFYTKDK